MKFILPLIFTNIVFPLNAQTLKLLRTTTFHTFPSASAVEYHNNGLYVFGDDATSILVLDKNYNVTSRIQLFNSKQKRIPKETKADIEAAAILKQDGRSYLAGISSFSTPIRNKIYFSSFPLKKTIISPDYNLVKRELFKRGIKEINIEGATFAGNQLLLSNRANTTNRNNYLLRISLKGKKIKNVVVLPFLLADDNIVIGVSGLEYIAENDMLLFTASVEDTPNSYEDGKIGDSYFGYVSDFSSKASDTSITPDFFISLSKELKLKGDNKIESVAVESFSSHECIMHFVADDDKGTSIIYKVKMNFRKSK